MAGSVMADGSIEGAHTGEFLKQAMPGSAMPVEFPSNLHGADPYPEGQGIPEQALSQRIMSWLDEADDAVRFLDPPDVDIPKTPAFQKTN
jgi:hypothetical protein